ncbi:MAG: flagellar FliJ family protein [Nocardioidaceae bacterium]|nr:flagellar FliJ family protein [Nocardioidaceae bacterium]
MSARVADRGLKAVERVRGVREQDSRIGQQHALAEERAVIGRLDGYHSRLAGAGASLPTACTPRELVSLRSALGMLGDIIATTREEAATATALAADARGRWAADKARLSAVEHLLERRAERRRAEAARRTAAELDDLAAQRWLRVSTGSTDLGSASSLQEPSCNGVSTGSTSLEGTAGLGGSTDLGSGGTR